MTTAVLTQPIANQKVEPIPLHQYVTESSEKNFLNLKCKAITYKALEIISWVAFVVIMATVFSLFYTGVVLTGAPAYLMVGLIISTAFLPHFATKFSVNSFQYSSKAETEGRVMMHLKKLLDDNWDTDPTKIEQFFKDIGPDFALAPKDVEALKRVDAEKPFNALLPLIARYNFLKELSEAAEKTHKERPLEVEEEFRKKEAETGKPIDFAIKKKWRLEGRSMAWFNHEFEAIPRALEAAVMLEIIQKPTSAGLCLPMLGELRAKTFDERTFDRIYAPINDDYFVFHPKFNRKPLTLTEIEQNMAPNALRRKLFPNAIRA